MYKIILSILSIVTLNGCGGSSSKDVTNQPPLDKTSKNYFGILSDATVNIYELGEGDKKLLFTENTSSGQNIDEIGNFNPHFNEMQRDKFYLYEVKGGENMDANQDGIVDQKPTKNRTVYSAIYKGYKIHVGYRALKTTNKGVGLSEKLPD